MLKPGARLPRINAMTRDHTVTVLLTGLLAGYWLGGNREALVAILRPLLFIWS